MTFDRARLPDPVTYFEGESLTLVGSGRWRTTRCPLHGGESLRVNVESGAFACMAGCDLRGGDVVAYAMKVHGLGFKEAARSLGAWVDDGKSDAIPHPDATRLSMRERLEVLYPESIVLFVVGNDMHRQRAISDADFERLSVAVQRIGHVAWNLGE